MIRMVTGRLWQLLRQEMRGLVLHTPVLLLVLLVERPRIKQHGPGDR